MANHVAKKGNKFYAVVELPKKENGKRNQKWVGPFTTEKEAKREYAKALLEIKDNNDDAILDNNKNITLEDYFHYLMKMRKMDLAPSTVIRYKYFIKCVDEHMGEIKLLQLTSIQIQNFIHDLMNKSEIGDNTVRKTYRFLHMALEKAIIWGFINKNPSEGITIPKEVEYKSNIWNMATANDFIKKIENEKICIAVMIAYCTGMREAEISGLKWRMVNLDEGYIEVREILQNLETEKITKEPKSKCSIRKIAFGKTLSDWLKNQKSIQDICKVLYAKTYKDEGYVCSWDNGRPLNPDYIGKRFEILVKKYKFEVVRFHDLRHLHGTILAASGVNLITVKEILGHASITTTQRYAHNTLEQQLRAAQIFENQIRSNN